MTTKNDNSEKKIILTDDHALVRKGLKGLIEKLGPYKIVAEFENGKALIDAYPYDFNPDLLILDLSMPVMDGTQVVKWMKENNVLLPTLLLTLIDTEEIILSLFKQGIRGYLNKNCDYEELRNALNQIFTVGYYHDEMMSKAMTFDGTLKPRGVKGMLSDKQIEFLRLVSHEEEYTYEQIADVMGITRKGVEYHRTFFFENFGVKSKTGLVIFAMKNNLLD
jgi:DNA-binding NarL/FixJ family response regulator